MSESILMTGAPLAAQDRAKATAQGAPVPPAQFALPASLFVGAVLAMAQPSPRTIREARHPSSPSPHAGLLDAGGRMRMLRISLEPGAGLPWRKGYPPLGGYLVKGELHFPSVRGSVQRVGAGDTLMDHPQVVWDGRAGPEGATVMVFYANEA